MRPLFSSLLAAWLLAAPSAFSEEMRLGTDMMKTTSIGARTVAPPRGGTSVAFGVYDPHDRFKQSRHPQIEHVFVYWQALDRKMLAKKIRLARDTGRIMMVTVEPYTKAANWRDGGGRLFGDILNGKFDRQIADVCGILGSVPSQAWIRWGHEMEDPTGRYPWARNDPRGYAAAYRYFVDQCRQLAPKAKFIWSPKGEKGLSSYYPGNAHVDMVGVSVWGLEKWDRSYHGRPRGFAETFAEKYARVGRFGKPVIIAELGVAGREDYRRAWMAEIFRQGGKKAKFPLLKSVVYFNDKEPHYWPNGFGSPDWRATPADIENGLLMAVSSSS
jgi:beta-mannanase